MTLRERFVPKSKQEAVALLSEYGHSAKMIAGGTDLLIQIKKKTQLPEYLISLEGIQDLAYIQEDEKEGGLRIGALTTMRSLETSPLVREKFPFLAEAAGIIGALAIRHRATLGGNLCNASPSADTAPALIVLGASVKMEDGAGEAILPVEEFFKSPGRSALKPGQLVTEIRIPPIPPQYAGVFLRQSRSQGSDLAIVGVAVLVGMEGSVIREAKIALGAVAPTPFRATRAEEMLKGKTPDDQWLEASGEAAADASSPISDNRGSADYRRLLVKILVKRALSQAVEKI